MFFTKNFYIKLPSLFHEKAFFSFLVDFYRNYVAIIGVSSTGDNKRKYFKFLTSHV